MRYTAANADYRMGKPSNIKDGRLGNGRSIVFQTNLRELLRMAENGVSGKLTDIKINIECDVSETLTGLKAVQREAKEAVKALRELETLNTNMPTMTEEEIFGFNKTIEESNYTLSFAEREPSSVRMCIETFSRSELVNELKRRGLREKIYHRFLPKGETLHINTKQEPGMYDALSEVLIIVD